MKTEKIEENKSQEKEDIINNYIILIQGIFFNIGIWIPSTDFNETLDDILNRICFEEEEIKISKRIQEMKEKFYFHGFRNWESLAKFSIERESRNLELRSIEEENIKPYISSCKLYYALNNYPNFEEVKNDYNQLYNDLMKESTKDIKDTMQPKKKPNQKLSQQAQSAKKLNPSNFISKYLLPIKNVLNF